MGACHPDQQCASRRDVDRYSDIDSAPTEEPCGAAGPHFWLDAGSTRDDMTSEDEGWEEDPSAGSDTASDLTNGLDSYGCMYY